MNDREWSEHLFAADMEQWILNDAVGPLQGGDLDEVVDFAGQLDIAQENSSDSDDTDNSNEAEASEDEYDDSFGTDTENESSRHKITLNPRDRFTQWEANRLGKRLAYLLRYGAQKEGLKLYFGDYVSLDELLSHRLMIWHPRNEVLAEVDKSYSHRGNKRFETITRDGDVFIRACYGRKMDRNPCHAGTEVVKLLDQCLSVITRNLDLYDLQTFPDEYIITLLLHKLKRQKRLNNSVLKSILCPVIEKLDLEGVFLTEATLRIVTSQCPNLTFLSLRNCGYIITDHILNITVKKLPKLEVLNLSGCSHLTDKSLKTLLKLANLRKLCLCDLSLLTEAAILDFMSRAPSTLTLLDIYQVEVHDVERVARIARQRGMKVLLRGLVDARVVPENAAALPLQFRLTDG